MLNNCFTDNATNNFSSSAEDGWIQPSIHEAPLLAFNEKIIDGVYAATVDEKVVILPEANAAWFWADEWQVLESEADQDIAQGRFTSYNSMDDFIADLDN